jgi:hypothetical protein
MARGKNFFSRGNMRNQSFFRANPLAAPTSTAADALTDPARVAANATVKIALLRTWLSTFIIPKLIH